MEAEREADSRSRAASASPNGGGSYGWCPTYDHIRYRARNGFVIAERNNFKARGQNALVDHLELVIFPKDCSHAKYFTRKLVLQKP